ncbi:MAG: Fe-S cluster assembly protein SufD [Proteobacteria bacterium]|nr:Fe-S cluster assembly protein SufD [Pseudomonadota bacterium]
MSPPGAGPLEPYERDFEIFRAGVGGDPAWLRGLRKDAMGQFREAGFPSTRLEAWKYTSTRPIAEAGFTLAASDTGSLTLDQVEQLCFPVFACSLFVFVNGRFAPSLSTPSTRAAGLPFESLARLRTENPAFLEGRLGRVAELKEHPFAALNTAFLDDGAAISLPAGAVEEEPVHLVFVSVGDGDEAPWVTHPRVLVHAAAGSRVTIIQDHVSVGSAPRFTNAVTEVTVEENARVDLVLLQREGDASHHISGLHVRQERDSRVSTHTVTLGGGFVRNDLTSLLAGEGADCELRGLFLGTGDETVDNHTLVDHAVPHCTSRELYKGVLAGTSRGVFQGRVIVRPDAQQTNAFQSNPNLLLSDGAEVNTKPQLEIHADDMRCSHGATIGQLDPDALFYLRCRGIAELAARDLLTQGFATEITDSLPAQALGERVRELLLDRLHGAGNGARS